MNTYRQTGAQKGVPLWWDLPDFAECPLRELGDECA